MLDKVGFIGLGVMGSGMARNILASGMELVVSTSSPAKAAAFRDLGAAIADTPGEVARSAPLIVTCVPDGTALLGVVDALISAGWKDGLLVDCSTVAPAEVTTAAQRLAAIGARMIDAPVSGGRKAADAGTLTIMCGGEDADIERARPVLSAMGSTIHHVGPLGAGQTVKACNQLMVAVNLMGVCEAIALSRAGSVDPRIMRDVLSTGAARSGVLEAHALRYLDDALDGGFKSELLLKDLGIALSIGREAGRAQPATSLAGQLIQASCNAGFSKMDSAALGRFYDLLNGGSSARQAQ